MLFILRTADVRVVSWAFSNIFRLSDALARVFAPLRRRFRAEVLLAFTRGKIPVHRIMKLLVVVLEDWTRNGHRFAVNEAYLAAVFDNSLRWVLLPDLHSVECTATLMLLSTIGDIGRIRLVVVVGIFSMPTTIVVIVELLLRNR